jgi:hypothetical protein
MASQTSSPISYKSTHSSRSSVLERAREYNRRIEDQKHGLFTSATGFHHPSLSYNHNNKNQAYYDDRRRSKSLERGSADPFGVSASNNDVTGSITNNNNINANGSTTSSSYQQRSHSAGRASQYYPIQSTNFHIDTDTMNDNGIMSSSPTRNRAMASVNKKLQPPSAASSAYKNNSNNVSNYRPLGITPQQSQPVVAVSTMNKTPTKNARQDPQSSQQRYNHNNTTPTTATTTTQSSNHNRNRSVDRNARLPMDEKKEELHPIPVQETTSGGNNNNNNINNINNNNGPVVTPELLVDALSGHEDGLLAIAEKLMEHYDSGYDVMGEAIIDAFADVQKLFQHGV